MAVRHRVVFDLDGTLVDSVPGLAASANQMLAEIGRDPVTATDYAAFCGWGMRQQIKQCLIATGGVPEDGLKPYLARMMEIYSADPVHGSVRFEGVTDAINQLAARGYGLAVCTQKPEAQARQLLEALGLMPPITGLTGGGTLDVLKPDPAMLFHAADQIGTGPIVYVGDSTVDEKTAENAGVPFLFFEGGYRNGDVTAETRFADWSQLPSLIP
ncbi:HAD-IA family hydrolase [Pontivivens insulae]|uniref:HAD-IA family hydrolase n=1 Tax=Pontivivens insulae TaxID=1639689 RepID=UPI0013C2FCB1|nr:HAD-IA family hydrolase [Pontivivens insulae]